MRRASMLFEMGGRRQERVCGEVVEVMVLAVLVAEDDGLTC